jgi:hypothetical protein
MTIINSQEQRLLEKQILPKSEDFCIFGGHFGGQNGRHFKMATNIKIKKIKINC